VEGFRRVMRGLMDNPARNTLDQLHAPAPARVLGSSHER